MRTDHHLTSPAALAPAAPVRHALNGPTMGTRWSAVFYAAGPLDTDAVSAALQASVEAVDRQMSTWIDDSDLMRFNHAPVGAWVDVPELLLTVVATGLDIGRRSGGAFDIGMGDLVRAWGFNATHGVPDAAAVRRLATTPRRPTHDVLDLDLATRRLRKRAPVAIDLSGIAKGFGVDRLAETLQAFGIADYLVSIDGELRAGGSKPGGEPWRVAVEKPSREAREVAGVIELADGALATSGDYRHRVELEGESFSHTMDPRTGRPLANGIHAVTVRARTCMLADAWATALMILGEAGLPAARAAGIEAIFATDAPVPELTIAGKPVVVR